MFAFTPNAGGWAARRYAGEWAGLDAPRHLTHLTAEGAATLARTAGLRVVRTAGAPDPAGWRASAALASAGPDADWLDHLLKWPPLAAVAARLATVFHHPDTLVVAAERP